MKRIYYPNENKVYIGTRTDVSGLLGHQNEPNPPKITERLLVIADLPFSFIFDTVVLPFDIYDWSQMPPAVDPLLGWTLVKPLPSKVSGKPDDVQFPLNDKILGAVTDFIKKKNFRYGPKSTLALSNPYRIGPSQCYENGTGQHAVRLLISLDEYSSYMATYILVFNQADKLVNVIKYRKSYRSMCMLCPGGFVQRRRA